MTAWGNVELAVEAMRRGATDFVQKPWDNARLLETIQKQSKRRARTELELARHVQQKLFPQRSVQLKTLDYAGQCLPAREVSGDYYDFLDLGNSCLGFVLADVSGKGIAAALLMANLQACFRSQSELALTNPVALVGSINKLFFDSTPVEHYATMFFGVYNDTTRTLTYVNGGHLPPMLLRAGGELERLEPTGTVIGMFRDWHSDQQRIQVGAGDTLVMFSDGVTEAGTENDQEYGELRLLSILQTGRHDKISRTVDRIVDSVHAFSSGRQSDDLTVVALRGL
jgi:sigma-B regulation protein RsbU (phosphoserine phosphatase)